MSCHGVAGNPKPKVDAHKDEVMRRNTEYLRSLSAEGLVKKYTTLERLEYGAGVEATSIEVGLLPTRTEQDNHVAYHHVM